MSKFIELNSGKDKFIVNVNSISYVERSDLSGSVVHFAIQDRMLLLFCM